MAWGKSNASKIKPGEVAAAWRRSLRASVAEDWASAETWLERIVEADSSDLDAYHALARLYRRQGAIGRAIRMHQNLMLRTDLPKEARGEALFELARDFEEGGFTERAAASYEELIDSQPRHAESLERLVPLLAELREVPRALSLLRRLRRRNRPLADQLEIDLMLSQAQALAEEGEHDGARQALKRCLRRDKHSAPALALLGDLEAERGKSARALSAWKKAALADPDQARALYPKIDASFAARGGKPGAYESFLRGVLEQRPEDHAARIALARALGSRGDANGAIEELSRTIEIHPTALDLRAELGRQLLGDGQEAEALKAYAELIEQIERRDDDAESPS